VAAAEHHPDAADVQADGGDDVLTPLKATARVLLAVLFAAGAARTCAAAAARPDKQVLVLYSTRRTTQLVALADRELPRILIQGLPVGVDYYAEFVDEGRFPQSEFQEAFEEFLRSKYRDLRFDVVVAMGDNALQFVAHRRDDLFRGTPIVFFASGGSPPRPAHSTGIMARLNLAASVDLAMALQPDVRHLFVISAADDSNGALDTEARAQLKRFEPQLDVKYLSTANRPEFEAQISSLPMHSILYFVTLDRHGPDENFRPIEYLNRIAAVANAPTYSWVDSSMGRGVVGGSLKSQEAQVTEVSRLALRVLRGEAPESIPVASVDLNVAQVDWRQLERWGIGESRVPSNARILFRQPSTWEEYRRYIVAAGALVVVQAILIAALLYERRARQRAEMEGRRSLALAAHVDRQVALTAMSGSLAHELSQPLSAILHNAEAAEKMLALGFDAMAELRDILRDIRTADKHAAQIVQRHRAMLRKREFTREPTDIHAVVREALAFVAQDASERRVRIVQSVPDEPCMVSGDRVLLQQVVVNLVVNALDAMSDTPQNMRRIEVACLNDRETVEIAVRDYGDGLPSTVLSRLFEPFQTTKSDGVGIGLTIARSTIQAHDGTIEARNNPDRGATFRFRLSCRPAA
jgi:signal transduction histidine kinase